MQETLNVNFSSHLNFLKDLLLPDADTSIKIKDSPGCCY